MEQTRRRGRRGRQSCSNDVFDDVKASRPVVSGLRMVREEPRNSTIDILECKSAIRKQVHRRPQKEVSADWSQADHHKVPSSDGLTDLMAMLQSDNPRLCVLGCAVRVRGIDDSMRSSEVQHDRDLA